MNEAKLAQAEKQFAAGITSAELLNLFASWNIQLSEATLRKYVQLGLLPRSIRVGRKGKHQGSQGLYPFGVVHQILRVKALMAESYTIEEIQHDFFFMRSDMHALEQCLRSIFNTLSSVVRDRRRQGYAQDVSRDVEGAREISSELVRNLERIETRLTTRAQLQRVASL
jgi:hypothetical protein